MTKNQTSKAKKKKMKRWKKKKQILAEEKWRKQGPAAVT